MSRSKQIINPLVGFGQRSIGPYANRIRGATYARHVGLGDFEPPVVATLHAFAADGQGTLKGLVTSTGTMTFARTGGDGQTVTDFEELVKTCLDDELRFLYGRRVENLFYYKSGISTQNLQSTGWNATGGSTITGSTTWTTGGPGSGPAVFQIVPEIPEDGRVFVARVEVSVSADIFIRFVFGGLLMEAYKLITPSDGTIVFSQESTISGAINRDFLFQASGSGTVTSTKFQLQEVTDQANQNPDEYVSVGVLTAAQYGRFSNVDGVRCYADTNGNAVSSNVVTEGTGTELFTDTLDSERDLSDWTENEVTLGGSVVATDGTTLTNNGLIPSVNEGADHFIFKQPVISEDNTPYTYPFLAKPGAGSNWVYGRFSTQAGTWATAFFDVATGVIGTTADCAAKITGQPDGWYLCEIAANSEAGASEILYIFCADADGDINITTGDGATVWTYIDLPELRIGLGDWRALFEPFAANYADGADDLSGGPETVDVTAGGTGDFTLSVSGDAAVTVAAGTATGTGFGQATEGNSVTFNLSVTGTVTLTLDSGTLDKTDGLAQKQIEKAAVASSWIPTSGGSATRAVDDGTPFAQVSGNVDETVGMLIFDLNSSVAAADLPATTAIVSLSDAVNSLFRLESAADELKSFDGTNTASDSLAFAADNRYRFAARWSADNSEMQVGYKNITGAGSWQWGAVQTFDGAYTVGTDINMFFSGPNAPQRIRDLRIYGSDEGTAWIEDNF